MNNLRSAILFVAIGFCFVSFGQEVELLAYSDDGVEEHSLTVSAQPSSGLFTLKVVSEKKIGEIRIQVRNAKGDVVYSEVGKARTNELVRYIDRSLFRKGEYRIEVFAKHFSLTQLYSIR